MFLSDVSKLMYPWEQESKNNLVKYLFGQSTEKIKIMHMDEHMKKILDE
jgi:hypothetical protein